ncbi:sodium- and chloride-dependent GABA transporter 1-like [Tachypleus tridentatus]|uniref:sodium- and chloride-dependent GABA transporter 1-like n=1 Tax=Tachypleus tridentatus TaxID=6853 RepID=UPI003FD4940B
MSLNKVSPENETSETVSVENGVEMITIPDEMNQSVTNPDKEKEPERGEWEGKLDFVLSSINYAVGLGNVWRFPYLCYENGGGAFLFPYLICLVLCAVPLFFLEVAIGQYLSIGGIEVWNLVPIFKGIDFASMTIVCLYNIYYVVIIAWTLFYFVFSMTSQLPCESCGNWWNTKYCMKEGTNITNLNITVTEAKSPITEFWEDGYILCIVNPATSIFAGTVIFSVLGHMAYLKGDGTEVADVVKSGPGLAFLIYPEVVLQLPPLLLWATVFFFMLLILGINSQFCTMESCITGIVDEWASLLRWRKKYLP